MGDMLGIVSGMVWFVLLNFCYVLSVTPSLVHDEASSNMSKAGWIQIGNVLIHYYTVSALPLWTIAMFDRVRHYTKGYLGKGNNVWGKRCRFIFGWLFIVFLYLARWEFDVNGIAKNYSLDKEPIKQNILVICCMVPIVSIINAVFLHMISQNISDKNIRNEDNLGIVDVIEDSYEL